MGMFRVHFNNGDTSGHQYLRKPDKGAFVFAVVFQSILKRATNQFRESERKRFPWNLTLVNKQILACKFIEKVLYSRRFAWNKFNFLQELFSSTSPRDVSSTPANS